MVLYPNKLPESERVCSGICRQHPVSIHAPTQGATQSFLCYALFDVVSIHAPTQGATGNVPYKKNSAVVSIHAPTQGATVISRKVYSTNISFNPRTHAGCDPIAIGLVLSM